MDLLSPRADEPDDGEPVTLTPEPKPAAVDPEGAQDDHRAHEAWDGPRAATDDGRR
jgi:hypothetical protein